MVDHYRLDVFGILPFGAAACHLIFWGKCWIELDPVTKFSAPGFPVWQNGFGAVTPFLLILLILLIRNRRVWHFGPCAAPLALISCHTFRRAPLQACGRLGKRLRGIPPPTNAHHAGVEQVLVSSTHSHFHIHARNRRRGRAFVGQLRVLTHAVSAKVVLDNHVTKDGAGACRCRARRPRQLRLPAAGGPLPNQDLRRLTQPPLPLTLRPSLPPYAARGQPVRRAPCGVPCINARPHSASIPERSSAGATAGSLDARRAARQGPTSPPLLSSP